MNVIIEGFKPNGNVTVPCSKSEAHRVLIMAFLLKKKITIHNISYSDDICATMSALEVLGAKFDKREDHIEIVEYSECASEIVIDVKQSASTLRFLLPIAIHYAKEVTFKGDVSLFKRPIDVYKQTFDKELEFCLGADYLIVKGQLKSHNYKVNTSISSQFVTGMMFLLVANNKVKFIDLDGECVSKNYIDITINVMERFGVFVSRQNNQISVDIRDTDIKSYYLEGDYSQAANFLVLGAIKGYISVKNLCINSKQGDKVVCDVLSKMGAKVEFCNQTCVASGMSECSNIEIDLENCIDLGPILFVCAAFNRGTTRFVNTKRLSIKESDRARAMQNNLNKANVDIVVYENEVIIKGNPNMAGDFVFETFNDHRIAMAMSVFAVLNKGISVIKNVECVNKSYPNFVNDLFSLKI